MFNHWKLCRFFHSNQMTGKQLTKYHIRSRSFSQLRFVSLLVHCFFFFSFIPFFVLVLAVDSKNAFNRWHHFQSMKKQNISRFTPIINFCFICNAHVWWCHNTILIVHTLWNRTQMGNGYFHMLLLLTDVSMCVWVCVSAFDMHWTHWQRSSIVLIIETPEKLFWLLLLLFCSQRQQESRAEPHATNFPVFSIYSAHSGFSSRSSNSHVSHGFMSDIYICPHLWKVKHELDVHSSRYSVWVYSQRICNLKNVFAAFGASSTFIACRTENAPTKTNATHTNIVD